MTSPICSIIIRAYNEEKHVKRLLQGIQEQDVSDVQIILVDSGSTDGTRAAASAYPVEIVEIDPRDFTFGRSLNLGISAARAPFIVIASAHVYPVYPDWLTKLLQPFEDPKVGLVYGKQRGADTTQFSEHQIFHHWFPDVSVKKQSHPFCNNANSAIRKELWQLHPYDETLTGLEDLEWGKWVQEQGYSIYYIAEAEIIHVHNESLDGIYNRYKREAMAFKHIYPHESFSLRDLQRLFLQNVISDCKEARRQRLLTQDFFKIIGFRWRQFYGTYQGYRQSGPLTWQLKKAFYYPREIRPASRQTSRSDIDPIQYN
ncbi:MAG TPA: glycosyltransferase family A protein [Anaerolineaceae bacterium]|nr:glycosyltransferase family A protein [Anaerolineaceae bacterium]